jgi:ubiquinone/menaquinone biosynthesis C-methylase UbiE
MDRNGSMNTSHDAEKLYNDKASLYQKVFIGYLNWGKQLENFFRNTSYLQPNLKVLDAGCGTGAVTKALYKISHEKGYAGIQFYGFDLTENMLKIFQQWIITAEATNIQIAKANVLNTSDLPVEWGSFDLIVSSAMLEYLPRETVKDALANLKKMLKGDGKLVVIITKRNLLTKWFAGKWWEANLYKKAEIRQAFVEAGFEKIEFCKFTLGWSSAIIVIEGENTVKPKEVV